MAFGMENIITPSASFLSFSKRHVVVEGSAAVPGSGSCVFYVHHPDALSSLLVRDTSICARHNQFSRDLS